MRSTAHNVIRTLRPMPARAGIGLRAQHHEELLRDRPEIGWLEAHSENYFADGGAQIDYLLALRELYPLSLHGVVSGSLIVFILAIGFFITPALMGGPSDVMIAMLIERAVEITLDWPSAAFMSLLLLAATLLLYAIYYKVTDVRRMMGAAT